MEKTYKRVPFDIELAKKIQSGEIEGNMYVSDDTHNKIRIICFDRKAAFPKIIALEEDKMGVEWVVECNILGQFMSPIGLTEHTDDTISRKIIIELPEEAPKQKGELTLGKCKEGDEVWIYSNYEYGPEYVKVKVGKFSLDRSSGRRRNVTFENGFTCQELVCQTCWYENPEEAPKHEFKPFDKVLVREVEGGIWYPKFFGHYGKYGYAYDTNEELHEYIIHYEGNEHLVGTTSMKIS